MLSSLSKGSRVNLDGTLSPSSGDEQHRKFAKGIFSSILVGKDCISIYTA